MIKPGGTTGLYRGRVMKKKVVCIFRLYRISYDSVNTQPSLVTEKLR